MFKLLVKYDKNKCVIQYIYTDKATGKKWGSDDSVVSSQWTVHGAYYYRLADVTDFAEIPVFGEERFGPSFKKQFARIFEGCPTMQQMVKDKNYSEDVSGLIAAFRDYNSLNCPDDKASAQN